jgi:hypothetical protein
MLCRWVGLKRRTNYNGFHYKWRLRHEPITCTVLEGNKRGEEAAYATLTT